MAQDKKIEHQEQPPNRYRRDGDGTPRGFMLATCEQAVVMVLGLPLEEGEWQLYINDPDLDAVLAAWVLMNHASLRASGGKLLYHAMPLIRVEGVIDAHGTDSPGRSVISTATTTGSPDPSK